MALLNEYIQKQLTEMFEGLEEPVKLVMFTSPTTTPEGSEPEEGDCAMCDDTQRLLAEVAELSGKIEVEVHDFTQESALAESYGINKVPGIVVLGGAEAKDYGIRLYGIPSGYEFATLVEDIRLASLGKTDLTPRTVEMIGKIHQPVHIQVFSTPT